MSHNPPGNRRRSRKALNPPPDRSCWPERIEVEQFINHLTLKCQLEQRIVGCLLWDVPEDREDAYQEAVTYFFKKSITGYIKRLWYFRFSDERAQALSPFAISYIRRAARSSLITEVIRKRRPKAIGMLNEAQSAQRRSETWQDDFWGVVHSTLSLKEQKLVKLYVRKSFSYSQTAAALGWGRARVTLRLESIFAKLELTVDEFLDGRSALYSSITRQTCPNEYPEE